MQIAIPKLDIQYMFLEQENVKQVTSSRRFVIPFATAASKLHWNLEDVASALRSKNAHFFKAEQQQLLQIQFNESLFGRRRRQRQQQRRRRPKTDAKAHNCKLRYLMRV